LIVAHFSFCTLLGIVTKKPKFENGGEVSMRTGSDDQYKPTVDLYWQLSKKIAFSLRTDLPKAGIKNDNIRCKVKNQ
jgi:iron complex outermembrane recepter protein